MEEHRYWHVMHLRVNLYLFFRDLSPSSAGKRYVSAINRENIFMTFFLYRQKLYRTLREVPLGRSSKTYLTRQISDLCAKIAVVITMFILSEQNHTSNT